MDPAHGFFSSEKNPKFRYFGQFALKPPGFPKLTRGPQILQFGPKFEKYLQKGP
jgi:hypothetical protein